MSAPRLISAVRTCVFPGGAGEVEAGCQYLDLCVVEQYPYECLNCHFFTNDSDLMDEGGNCCKKCRRFHDREWSEDCRDVMAEVADAAVVVEGTPVIEGASVVDAAVVVEGTPVIEG